MTISPEPFRHVIKRTWECDECADEIIVEEKDRPIRVITPGSNEDGKLDQIQMWVRVRGACPVHKPAIQEGVYGDFDLTAPPEEEKE